MSTRRPKPHASSELGGRAPTSKEKLYAKVAGRKTIDRQEQSVKVGGQERLDRGSYLEVEHSERVVLYDPQGDAWEVPVEAMIALTNLGMNDTCPLCGGRHPSKDPNACPARGPLEYALCPVCRQNGKERRIYDQRTSGSDVQPEEDALEVKLDMAQAPQERIRARVYQHMIVFHPQESLAFNIPPHVYTALAAAPR